MIVSQAKTVESRLADVDAANSVRKKIRLAGKPTKKPPNVGGMVVSKDRNRLLPEPTDKRKVVAGAEN
jgi:hypothetical protein